VWEKYEKHIKFVLNSLTPPWSYSLRVWKHRWPHSDSISHVRNGSQQSPERCLEVCELLRVERLQKCFHLCHHHAIHLAKGLWDMFNFQLKWLESNCRCRSCLCRWNLWSIQDLQENHRKCTFTACQYVCSFRDSTRCHHSSLWFSTNE